MGAQIHLARPYRASHVSGRGCTRPGGSSRRGAPSHVPVEAPCSVLADDTAEERLCPYTYGSAMLRAGDKQLRVAPGPHQPQGAQSSVSSLIIMPPLGSAARGGLARGLRLGHAQTHAAQPGPPGPGSSRVSPRAEPRYEGRLSVKGDS